MPDLRMDSSPQVFIVAGKASGDLHGANLARELRRIAPDISRFGIGGPRMHEVGVELVYSIDQMGLVGFTEILRHLPFVRRVLKELVEQRRPHLAILIDYPGFNLRLANVLKKAKISVLYYIGPQVWAWRLRRARKIGDLVDRIAVVFPFEVDIYRQVGVKVEFVGHPLVEAIEPRFSKEEFCRLLGVSPHSPLPGLLPGSRRMEVDRLLPIMLEAARLLQRDEPELQVVLGLAPAIDRAWVEGLIGRNNALAKVAEGLTHDVMKHSDLLLVASGTATLELACLGTPMVILYKVGFLSWLIGKWLIKIPDIGLVNILADHRVVPELVQFDAKPQKVAAVALPLLRDRSMREHIRGELVKVREKLGPKGLPGTRLR